jgi:hypothetical protein
MRVVIVLALALFFAIPAQAQDQKVQQPQSGAAMKVGDAIALRNALMAATGGHDKIVGQGTSTQTVAHAQLYDIDNNARWAMNDDIVALNTVLDGIDLTVKQLRDDVVKHNGDAPFPAKDSDWTLQQQRLMKKFNDDYAALMASTRDFPALTHVKRGDFHEPLPGEAIVPMEQAGIIDRQ